MSGRAQRADYAASRGPVRSGGRMAVVDPGSPAERCGLRVGDVVVSADGSPVRDIIDWQWLSDGARVDIGVSRDDEIVTVTLERDLGETWGIEFDGVLFDRVRTCRNRCTFCFMSQLPKGLRRALYVRDDDFRLSFLQGNFVTLTNLDEEDVDRIVEQHLSPLYVSLHAVDLDVRARLVCASEDRAVERIDRLLEAGIDLHVQIVLVPGVNDCEVLDHTLTWLAEREGIASVGVVPLGFTRHQVVFSESYNNPEAAAAVLRQISEWQEAFRARDGVSWVHAADEFYLNAGQPVPAAEYYDDFPQYENGIGIVRSFLDECAQLGERLRAAGRAVPKRDVLLTLVTGTLAAATIERALASYTESAVRTLGVKNSFFGGNVSVSGLLTGADIASAIIQDGAAGIYLLPDIVLNADGLTLDDMTLDDVRERAGADVRLVSSDAAGLLAGLEEVAAEPVS